MPTGDRAADAPLRAIVLGVNGHSRAIAAVRSLGRAKIPMIGVRVSGLEGMQKCHSRYLRRTFVANPTEDELLPLLETLSEDGGVLYPVYDSYIRFVSMHADALAKRFTLTVPPWEVLSRVMHHSLLYDAAKTAGVNAPNYWQPRDEADLRRILAGLDLANREYLLKTVPAVGPIDVASGRATKVAEKDPDRVYDSCVEVFSRLGEYPLIAEVIPGEANECIAVTMVVDRNQAPVLTYCTQRLKLQLYTRGGFVHPYALGSNVYCQSVHDEEAVEAALRLVKTLGYYGLITIEFRRDPRDQKLFLIKADPRVVRSTGISTALGMDTPTAQYRLSVGDRVPVPQSYPDGVAWLWETNLLEAFWDNRDSSSMRKEMREVARNFGSVKAFAYFSLSDPLPFLLHAQWRLRAWLWIRIRNTMRRCANALRRPTGPSTRAVAGNS